jgi:hypothetical protein
LDRTALAIIAIGVFLGLVYSLSLEVGRYNPPTTITGEANSHFRWDHTTLRSGAGDEVQYVESPAPPSKEVAGQDLGYDTEVFDDASRGATSEDKFSQDPGAGDITEVAEPTFLAVGDDGVLAYYAETKMAYNYSGYDLALVRFEAGGEGRLRQALVPSAAVIVDETDSSLLLLVPEGWEAYLDSLVKDGTLRSYELGGLGTGLGKA